MGIGRDLRGGDIRFVGLRRRNWCDCDGEGLLAFGFHTTDVGVCVDVAVGDGDFAIAGRPDLGAGERPEGFESVVRRAGRDFDGDDGISDDGFTAGVLVERFAAND